MSVLKKLFEEIMGIFPDQYVHMGADESWNVLFFQKCNSKSKIVYYLQPVTSVWLLCIFKYCYLHCIHIHRIICIL